MPSSLRRAKILATLGPASSTTDEIKALVKAGANAFRFNFSHGTHEDHKKRFDKVRSIARELKTPIPIIQDLQGPKLRVGNFEAGSIELKERDKVLLHLENKKDTKTKSGEKKIPYNYKQLAKEIKKGHRILLDDGNLEFKVLEVNTNGEIRAEVIFGGKLKDHKGMNFPDTEIQTSSLTKKDKEDLKLGLELGVDYVALSFVRSKKDIQELKKLISAAKKKTPVLAKIEKQEAITNLEDILSVTDGAMVARGDLAVEVGTEHVPFLQKKIIHSCNIKGLPVITATQMLESMIESPRPTRAEASDVANAVLDGSDALMLSAESASGKHPALAVSTMAKIILETEQQFSEIKTRPQTSLDALERAASNLAEAMDAKAIICATHSGRAARVLAQHRPIVPILAFSDSLTVRRQLALIWGIESAPIEPTVDIDKLTRYAQGEAKKRKLVSTKDKMILVAVWPLQEGASTNLLKVIHA